MRALTFLLLLPHLTIAKVWSGPTCPDSIKQVVLNSGHGKSSDLQEIYQTLTRCSNAENSTIRTLHLKIQQSGCVIGLDDRWNFDFHAGDVFPPLHQLHLDGYDF